MQSKKILLALGAILLVGVLGVGSWYVKNNSVTLPLASIGQERLFEDLLPADAFMAASFNPTSEEERAKFMNLWGVVFQDQKDAVIAKAFEFVAKNQNINLAVEDLYTLMGKSFVVAARIDPTKTAQGTAPTPNDPNKVGVSFSTGVQNAEIYILTTLDKPVDQVQETIKKLSTQYPNIKGGVIGNVVYITSTQEAADQIKERYTAMSRTGKSLASNSLFKESFKKVTTPLSGYFYLNMEFLPTNWTNFGSLSPAEAIPPVKPLVVSSPVRASLTVFRTDEKGVKFESISLGDKKKLKNSPLAESFKPYAASLYKKVSLENALFFTESHHLNSVIAYQLEILKNLPGAQGQDPAAGFKQISGIDINEDLLPFLDRGYAVVVSRTAAPLPSFSFYVDASSAPDKAKGFADKLNTLVDSGVAFVQLALAQQDTTPTVPLIQKVKLDGVTNGWTVTINFKEIPKEAGTLPLFEILGDSFSFSYGFDEKENIFFFTTLPEFKTITPASEPELLIDAKEFTTPLGNVVLFDAKVFLAYLDSVIVRLKTAKTFSEENQKLYDDVKKYFTPLKGLVQVGSGDGTDITYEGILKIAP